MVTYQWQTKVDRKTISEAKLEINPELELGDKIRVISVDRDDRE